MPIPIETAHANRKSNLRNVREELGIPDSSLVLLTIGSGYKYVREEGRSFTHALTAILRAREHVHLIVVGPSPTEQWEQLAASTGRRAHVVGTQRDLEPFWKASNIYLESFPFGGPTALMEAASYGLACVRGVQGPAGIYVAEGEDLGCVPHARTVEEFITYTLSMIDDKRYRAETANSIQNYVRYAHCGEHWTEKLEDLKRSLPPVHSVHSLSAVEALPEEVTRWFMKLILNVYGIRELANLKEMAMAEVLSCLGPPESVAPSEWASFAECFGIAPRFEPWWPNAVRSGVSTYAVRMCREGSRKLAIAPLLRLALKDPIVTTERMWWSGMIQASVGRESAVQTKRALIRTNEALKTTLGWIHKRHKKPTIYHCG